MRILLFTSLMLFFITSLGHTQEIKPEIKIGGTLYTGWDYNVGNSEFINMLDLNSPDANQPFGYMPTKNQFETSKNSFYLERAYINVLATIGPQIKARFTPDIYSFTDGKGTTQYSYQVKFAWLEYTPLKTDEGLALSFTGGLVPNLWVGQIEKAFGYRGAVKTLTDILWTTSASVNTTSGAVTRTTSSYFSTADLGVIAKLSLPKNYADVSVAVYNGNGFRNLSFDNRFKDVMFSGFVYPLAGDLAKKREAANKIGKTRIDGISDLTIGGFGYIGKLGGGEGRTGKTRYGGMANFKYNFNNVGFVKVGGEYSVYSNEVSSTSATDSTVNGNGISTWIEFNPPIEELKEKVSVVGRFDWFDPNTNKPGTNAQGFTADNGKQSLIMIGLFYKPVNMVTLGMNYQLYSLEKDFAVKYDGTPTSTVSKLFFNFILEI